MKTGTVMAAPAVQSPVALVDDPLADVSGAYGGVAAVIAPLQA